MNIPRIMRLSVVAAVMLTTLALLAMSSVLVKAYAQTAQSAQIKPIKCQTGALIGYGGTIFGLSDVCTNGNLIDVDVTTNHIPQSGKVFEAWLVDDFAKGSDYALSMGKILNSGGLRFQEVMNNATTYTDIVVTQEPVGDLSPLPSWSNAVAQTWLIPPFAQ